MEGTVSFVENRSKEVKKMTNRRWLTGACMAAAMIMWPSTQAEAQKDDFGVWLDVGIEKKLSSKWSMSAELDFRTRNNSKTLSRWSSFGLNAEYKIVKHLKASAGYMLLYDNNPEELDLKSDKLTPNKWTPSYWHMRHRTHVTLTGSASIGRLGLSLRERWQYTYRPAAEGKRYDIDEATWGDIIGKGKNIWRNRLQMDYDIAHWRLDPFASAETFVDKSGIQKIRYTVGVDYKIKKQHVFSVSYKYQNVNDNEDDTESNSHILGLSYKYKF